MDEPLHRAWVNGTPPFNGLTLRPADLVRLELLSGLLAKAVRFLQLEYPGAELMLHADWHAHDGYVTSSDPIDWQALKALVESPQSLYEHRPGDDFVCIGVYESRGSFYLRIRVPDENDPESHPGRWGTFDVSASEPTISKLGQMLAPTSLLVSDAKAYFDERYAG